MVYPLPLIACLAVFCNNGDNMSSAEIRIMPSLHKYQPNQVSHINTFYTRPFLSLLITLIGLSGASLQAQMQSGQIKALDKAWNDLGIASKYHVGISVYDLQKRKPIFNYRADNFFTPASNIKILTMYAALELLDEQLDAALYTEHGDSLFIWGGGDPGTFYPDIDVPGALPDFISASDKTIVFSDQHFRSARYGRGWSWDDYPHTFQCERNAFPVYGNRLWINRRHDTISITPSYLIPLLKINTDTIAAKGKSEWGDGYFYTYNPQDSTDEVELPITFFKNDVRYSWAEATGKEILLSTIPLPGDALSVRGSSRDTLIRIMMQESDNFIAEQLLLSCSLKKLHYMMEQDVIDTLLNGPLADLPDDIDWVDGSGLSVYNQMTPRSVIAVLLHLLEQKDMAYMKAIFPAAGQSGTLKAGFKLKNGRPYIFAKSGSLSNTYCLSGFLLTKSGNILLFSWMNNQVSVPVGELKTAMESFFSFLYEQY